MIVSGLLVTLAPNSNRHTAIALIRSRPGLTTGELNDRWLPVAIEARDDAHSREIHDWIGAQPGVEFVDVVSVNFDNEEESLTESEASQNSIRHRSESAGSKPGVLFSALND